MLIQGNQPFQANNPFAAKPFQNNVIATAQKKPPEKPTSPEQGLPRFLNYYADY